MVYGFCGAHRSGKTTLARRVAEDLGIEFLEVRTGPVMKAHGINIVADMPMNERIAAQEILLAHHVKTIEEAGRPLITDRTPLDMAAYTLGEVFMNRLKMETDEERRLDARVDAYVATCMALFRRHYQAAVMVKPLEIYVDEDGKPPASRAYQWHFNYLLRGLLDSSKITHAILNGDDFERRVESAGNFVISQIEELERERNACLAH